MMTREEFKAGIVDALEQINDETSEFSRMIDEGRDVVNDLFPHDPMLAAKFDAVVVALVGIRDYVKSKTENT